MMNKYIKSRIIITPFSPVTPTCSYSFISASLCFSFPKAPLPSGPTSPSFLLAAAPGVLVAPSRFHWAPALAPWLSFFPKCVGV